MNVALAVSIFESVKAKAYRSHMRLVAQMARRMPEENLWILDPQWERRTYPFCVNGMVVEMMAEEDRRGLLADWFFWLEDDIVPSGDTFDKLIAEADEKSRPFVAALGYCRTRPYWPGIASRKTYNGIVYNEQWQEAPTETVPVDLVGMCACLIHRRLFDVLPEPWFEAASTSSTGIGPDASFCRLLTDYKIQPYVCGGAEVGHIGDAPVITRELSERWNAARKSE